MYVSKLNPHWRRLNLWRAEASFKFDLKDSWIVEIISRSLNPEIKFPLSNRVSVSLDVEGCLINICIKADSPSSLRATINSYLRWVSLLLRSLEVVQSLLD